MAKKKDSIEVRLKRLADAGYTVHVSTRTIYPPNSTSAIGTQYQAPFEATTYQLVYTVKDCGRYGGSSTTLGIYSSLEELADAAERCL